MFSYISFYNSSARPILVVFLDEVQVEELLFSGKKGPLHITEPGSHSVRIADSSLNPLFDLYLPLFPGSFYTLIIENDATRLTDHIP